MKTTMKIRVYLLAAALLMTAGACQNDVFPDNVLSDGTSLAFTAAEASPELLTKAASASDADGCLVLTAADGRTLTLSVTEEPLRRRTLPTTKASKIYGKPGTGEVPLDGDPFAVWAYNYSATGAAPSTWQPDGGATDTLAKAPYDALKKLWIPDPNIPFNRSNRAAGWKTRWFALAPWDACSGTGAPVSVNIAAKTATYTVPSEVSKHWDLLAATTREREVSDGDPVALTFGHVLTGVRFKKDAGLDVASISLSGLYDKATLDLTKLPTDGKMDTLTNVDNTGADTDLWSGRTQLNQSYSLSMTAGRWTNGRPDDRTQETQYDYADTAGTMMMIPQWLPDGAKIVANVGGTDYTGTISGHRWLPGRMVTYRITTAAGAETYHLEVDGVADVTADTTVVVKVRSYSTSTPAGGDTTAAPWSVKGVYSTEAKAKAGGTPDMTGWKAVAETHEGSADASGENIRVTIRGVRPSVTKTVDEFLQDATPWGSDTTYWNLANRQDGNDNIVESANSYIINAPGWYRIPLVAGNGVKNNAPNTEAYPSNFVDYKGVSLGSPYLHKTSSGAGTPTSAYVVWAENDIVEDLKIVSTGADDDSKVYWLRFQIQASKIKQGCTVVAVKDDAGTVMWSWLLWATDYEPGVGDVAVSYTSAGETATLMPRNLGWSVDGKLTFYPASEAWLRIESEEDPTVYKVVRVHRPAGEPDALPHSGHGPLFQWGRKDAMPPVVTLATGSFQSTAVTTDMTVSYLIQHPEEHVRPHSLDYPLKNGYNWWSANATDVGQAIATVKTIYDPCPAGYAVPRVDAFDGLAIGFSVWDNSATPEGYAFNTGYQTGGAGTLYLPAGGRRQANATESALTDPAWGHYWTAVPQGSNTGRRLFFTDGKLARPTDGSVLGVGDPFFNKAGEHSVRPARIQ